MTRSNKGYAKSFISEHTAEYTLIPNLKNIIQKRFRIVTPLFPWVTKEGSAISRRLHKGERFKVVGLYPRRPKLRTATSSIIIVKLNRQILLGAQCGMELGIPIIAGCPLAKSFWELGNSPTCLWIKLDQSPADDIELRIGDIRSLDSVKRLSKYIFLDKEDLLSYLVKRTAAMGFDRAMQSFRQIRGASEGTEFFYRYFGGYKPVYFLLKNPHGIKYSISE